MLIVPRLLIIVRLLLYLTAYHLTSVVVSERSLLGEGTISSTREATRRRKDVSLPVTTYHVGPTLGIW